jgi:pyruvate dehydrogenase E2 component (dihydrolipoamide acetyltransferase)
MAKIIRMPEVLAGAEEAVIAQWLKEEGADVAIGDTLAEIETEKATVEYQAEDAGTLGRVLLTPGTPAQVGDPIAVFVEPGDGDDAIDQALAAAGISDGAPEAPATTPEADTPAVPDTASSSEPAGVSVGESDTAAPGRTPGDRVFISPIARKLAKERGIDPAAIAGSGPDGRIVRRDVEDYVPAGAPQAAATTPAATPAADPLATAAVPAQPASTTPVAPGAPSAYTDTPHTPMRKAIARRLTESKSTVPHFYLVADVRVDKLLALRQEVNDGLGVKISVNDWVVKAVATALIQVPEANVIWTDGALRHFTNADISIAVATEGGLYTPVVRGANHRSVSDISATVKDLAERSRAGQIRQDEIEGGSFAITNLGMFGTAEFSAILNPPQSGILAVGAAKQKPVVDNGELAVGMVMTLTLSCDHRAIDGALAAVFLDKVQTLLENPASTLAV